MNSTRGFIAIITGTSMLVHVSTALLLLVAVDSVHAETWMLCAKTQLFGLDSAGKKTRIDWFSNPAAETKERSSFNTKALCEAQRTSLIQKFRDVQGKIEMPDDKRIVTIKVDGEIISMVTEFGDGEGSSYQHIELLCRNDL